MSRDNSPYYPPFRRAGVRMTTHRTEVTVYLREDTEVNARVELTIEPDERGPDGIGTIPGGISASILSTDAPFGLTVDEERHIEEKACEDYEPEDDYDDEE